MDATLSKSALVYRHVRRALRSGCYLPGQRIDPARLATDFKTSLTPVGFGLYRLASENQLADHARDGLHVPLPTEVALRSLYDWMEHLLLTACDIRTSSVTGKPKPLDISADGDLVKLTWQMFEAIAASKVHQPLELAARQANDRLSPIRRVEPELIEHCFEELSELNRHWQARDIPALKSELHEYHERRKQLVPCIVALLNDRSEELQ
jgi:hypothetical protein